VADPNVWKWLESTKKLQEKSFGFKLPLPEGDALADYVTWNHSALVLEAGELLSEFGWKIWTKNRGWVNRELALKEAVDVGHFLANILAAIGVTDEEWVAAYQAKQQVNRDRMSSGTYDGVSTKCPGCKRAYDDDINCTPAKPRVNGGAAYCGETDMFIVNKEETCPYCSCDYADTAGCYTDADGTPRCNRRHTPRPRE
jgi:hypothetical protein